MTANAWGFAPGFLSTATHMTVATGGGGGPIDFPVAITSDATTTTSDTVMSVPVPTNTASGDCLIFFGSSTGNRTIAPPSGVTQVATSSVYGETYVWYKKAGSSESPFEFTASGSFSGAAVSALRVTGAVCDSTSDFTATTGGSSSSNNVATCPNITTPQNTMVVLWMESGDAGFTADSNNRGSATERGDVSGGAEGGHLSIWSEAIATAGTVTGAQITRSGYSGYDTISLGIKTQP